MYFIEVYFKDSLQQTYPINQEMILIGRSKTANIQIDNQSVSNIHTLIEITDGRVFVEDLNSTNGTLINDQKIDKKYTLKKGDTISISKYKLVVTNKVKGDVQQLNNANLDYEEDNNTVLLMTPDKQNPVNKQKEYLFIKHKNKKMIKLPLTSMVYTIGKAEDNDILLHGMPLLTPKYAAEIHRIGESFYIEPKKKSLVYVNKMPIERSVRLAHNDRVRIKSMILQIMKEEEEQ